MVADEVLDEVLFEPISDVVTGFRCRVVAPPQAQLVGDLLSLQSWSFVRYFAERAARGESADADGAGWLYDTDGELGESEEPSRAIVFMPWGEELPVGRTAFERTLARWLRALQAGGRAQRDPALAEPWWPDLEAATTQVERRVAAATG